MSKFLKVALLLSAIGLLVSLYLTYDHYYNIQVACPDTGIIDCSAVLNSQYSTLLGVPLTLWGMVFFIIEFLVLLKGNPDIRVIYNGLGLAFVVYFLSIEYTLQHICIYCTAVHVVVVSLFLLSLYYYQIPAGK